MWMLVYYSFEIRTDKSLDEVGAKLERIIKTDKDSELKNIDTSYLRPFKGTLKRNCFSVVGNYPNVNSFRPFIIGRLATMNEGNVIKVKMFMHWIIPIVLLLALLLSSFDLVVLIIALAALLAFNIEAFIRRKQLKETLS